MASCPVHKFLELPTSGECGLCAGAKLAEADRSAKRFGPKMNRRVPVEREEIPVTDHEPHELIDRPRHMRAGR